MKKLFYKTLIWVSRILGLWVFSLFAWIVSTGYICLFPRRVATGVRFYGALFPYRDWRYHLWCTWRQYHSFTNLFLDRVLLQDSGDLYYTSEGFEYLQKAVKDGTGGIILMSHLGNWEVAAHLLKKKLPDIRLLLYMGIKQKEQIERMQKEGLSQTGIRTIAVDSEGGSPFEIVEGIMLLKDGGFVSMTGDVIWNENQRSVPVKFLGHEVHLPEVPYLLALLSGAPLFVFFSFSTGENHYHFSTSKGIYIKPAKRSEREEAIRKSAQNYADMLEKTLKEHPFQWYHFEHFLGMKSD
jgi:predicted LPLAT superfamily acyltransferase